MKKEVCGPCTKFINIGQSILECEICFVAIHTRCYKKANFSTENGTWICGSCAKNILPRYNPFPCSAPDTDNDKFYDDEGASEDIIIQSISRVLDTCKPYTVQDLNKITRELNKDPENTNKIQFSSLFLNIDGNKTNFNSFCIELKRIEHTFPVIGLAETNIDPELKNLYHIPGYNSFYQSTVDGKSKGTGVALYVHENFNASIIEELSFCNEDIETLFVKLSQPSSNITLVSGVVYRSPSGNETNFLHKFENICSVLPESGVRILGDYNIDFLRMKSNTNRASQFEDHILSNALAPVISIPTHERYNCQPSCIDNILTNDIDKIMLSGTISDSIGDHLPVFELSNIYFKNDSRNTKHIKYYDYSNANLNKFITKLENDLTNHTVSENFSQFTDLFAHALDATCKLERPKMTKRTLQNNPWITDSIISAIERKHELKDNWVESITKKLPGGDPTLRKTFTDYRKILNQVINSAKNSFSCQKVLENKNDRKKTWQIINDLRGKTKSTIKPSFIIDNEKITNRRTISNEFNKYFNSIASKLNDTLSDCIISDCSFNSFEDFLAPTTNQSIYLEDCSETELAGLISGLDNNKASDIPIRIIKKSAHIIAPFLSEYFNLHMKLGSFPDVLKTGKITPIYKKGNPEDIGNYRPVSTLPIFGKLLEKVIYKRIFSFAQSQNIINPNQFGFRQSHSTSHAVNHSVKIIDDALRKKKHVLGIFIDLSKAFDTIDHDTLLVKLNRYGIRSNALNLIKSYLSRRTQYTEVLGEKSDSLTVEYGVPQGSVLGPLLFLLYINDISRASKLGTFIMFADDTNIFVEGQTVAEAYAKGNELLRLVQRYMLLNKLHINMSKCCYIHFKPKTSSCDPFNSNSSNDIALYIDQFPIKKVSETKFLGVIIDEHLSWESHITALRRKLNYASATLYRIRDSLPTYLRKDHYHTLYESHLSYCISVWGGCALYKTARLWVSQKQCIRLLFGDKEAFLDKFRTAARARPLSNQLLGEDFYRLEHTKPLFKEHNILVFKNLYVFHTYMELFKILKLRQPMVIFEQLKISDRKPDLIISDIPAEHFISKSTKIWNTLTPKLKLTDYSFKINTMKNNLKRLLLLLQNSNDPFTWTSNDFDVDKMPSL